MAVLGEGEAFGEEALLTGSARSATVRTIEDTGVWSLDKEDFQVHPPRELPHGVHRRGGARDA